jgi:hypothetical protein
MRSTARIEGLSIIIRVLQQCREMSQMPVLSPELARQTIALTRALTAAARNWRLYPPEHPSVERALGRLAEAVSLSMAGAAFALAVTPQTLLIAGVPLPADAAVVEAAQLLHDRDVLQLSFVGEVPLAALRALFRLLARNTEELRAAGRDNEHGYGLINPRAALRGMGLIR